MRGTNKKATVIDIKLESIIVDFSEQEQVKAIMDGVVKELTKAFAARIEELTDKPTQITGHVKCYEALLWDEILDLTGGAMREVDKPEESAAEAERWPNVIGGGDETEE